MENKIGIVLFKTVMLFATFSCEEPNLVEFKHVNETYRNGSYDYTYSRLPLDSIEIKQLSQILHRRGYSHVIRNGKIFYDRPDYVHIQTEFDIDRELVDTILARKLPRSQFVRDLVSNLD